MLMTAKTVICIAVLIILCSGEKKVLKSKHDRASLAQKPAKEKQAKNGKRWMGGFTQTYVTPNADLGPGGGGNEFGGPMGPVQYPNQFNPQTDPSFGSLNEEAMTYGFAGGFKEPQMNAAGPIVSPMQSPVKEQSMQGMEELKLNKQPSFVNPDEQLGGFASEVASYLKPGIGDFPSDMPGAMNNVNGMTAIGMPVQQMKPKVARINPTVQSQSKMMQTALEDAALNPTAMHKNPNPLIQGNAALTQAAENLDATDLLGNEPPAKILSAAPSPLPIDENSTAAFVANDSEKIDKAESAKEAADASPSPEEKVTEKPDVEASEKPETDKIEQEAKAEAKIETKTEAKVDSKPTPKVEAKEEIKEEVKATKEKGADDVEKDTNATVETETTKEKEKIEEKQVETETAKESPKPAAAKDEGKEKEIEEKEKLAKVKQTAANVETPGSNKVANAQKPDKAPTTDVPGAIKLVKSKHKVETGARRQNWERVVDTGHNRLEPVGLPEENTIAGFENGNGIEEAGVEDSGESIATIEAGDEDDNITPSRVKAKLVTSLKQALLQNSKTMMGKGAGKEEDDNSDDVVSDFDGKSAKDEDTEATENAENEEQSQAVGGDKSDLLEQNLMKIDKKKLVHLLANMMRKNREKEAEAGTNDNEQYESPSAASEKEDKGSEESVKSNAKETAGANEKSSKLSPKNENDGEDYQPKIAKIKHQQKAGSRHTQYDPYTQIGLTDPTNSQQEHLSKHAAHSKHEEKTDKEESEKEKKLTQILKIKKLVAASKDSDKEDKETEEKEEMKEEKEDAKEHMEDAKEDQKEDEKEDKEEAKEEEKEEAKEESKILEKAVKEADKKEEDTIKEKIKEIKEKQKENKEKEEQKAEAEEIQVEAQVEKERQELKKLKEEEKQEKEKESQLKAENAQLMAENENDKEEEEKSNEETDDNSEMVKDDTKLKEAQQAIYHLVNPAIVNNIADNKEKEENTGEEDTSTKMVTVNEERVNLSHAVKLASKVKDKEKEIQDLIKEKNKDKLKDEKGSIQKEEKSSPSKTEEDSNLQTLINRVKEKLGSSKQAKLLKGNPKEKELIKVKHTKKGFFDDAYAQIGSSDPNVKKRKTITTYKDKKRRLHNRSKVTKHQ